MMPSKEWWLFILVLGMLSASLHEIFFPNTSSLWQLPIGFVAGIIVSVCLES